MDINEMADRHHAWVASVGWHNKTPLECLALIHSEVSELANEFRKEPLDLTVVGEECADVILRVADLSREYGIDLSECVERKIIKNHVRGTRGRSK